MIEMRAEVDRVTIHQRHRQTDRQHVIASLDCALH